MARPEKIRLGDLLMQQKLISNEWRQFALNDQAGSSRIFRRNAVRRQYVHRLLPIPRRWVFH